MKSTTIPNMVVTIQAPKPVTLAAGGVAEAPITVVVAEGYHIQANPASSEFLVPARLELKARGGVRPGQPAYPRGQPYRLAGTSSDLMTYKGPFEIVVPLKASESARPGSRILQGVLRYQACDEGTCLFPASIPVELTVRVVPESDK
jgi:DsbC/DsbD-like thiol-disulfide interchange protein